MHDLAPICALGGSEPRKDTVAGVTLSENPSWALASVSARQGYEPDCSSHLDALLGGASPEPGKAVFGYPFAAFWMGPDQWMVIAPYATREDLVSQLQDRFGETASITEQTDGWVCFDMLGEAVEGVMQLCCNVDIELMRKGDATRTSIHYMGVYVLRHEEANALRVFGPRSSARSLHHALVTAMTAAL